MRLRSTKTLITSILTGFLLVVSTPGPDLAFTMVPMGETVPDLQLTSLNGSPVSYLGLEQDQATVFAFVKANHQRSRHLISLWQELENSFVGEPVRWTLIISDRDTTFNTAFLDSLGKESTVLVDTADRLYGALGVVLTPTVGIVDNKGLLQAYLPYRKINYPQVISAHLKFVLKIIDSDQLQKILAPSGRATDTACAGARRQLKLARMMIKRGKPEAALTQVEKALTECPDSLDALRLLAEIHETAGRSEEAAQATTMADQLTSLKADSLIINSRKTGLTNDR